MVDEAPVRDEKLDVEYQDLLMNIRFIDEYKI